MTDRAEQWRPVPDWPYEASSLGRVRNSVARRGHYRGKIVRPGQGKYLVAVLVALDGQRTMHYVHHLVAAAFLGPRPDGYQVNHINGDKHDNRDANLEYVTVSEQRLHAFRTGLQRPGGLRGSDHPAAVLTEADVLEVRRLHALGRFTQAAIAAQFGITASTVSAIATGRLWKHV